MKGSGVEESLGQVYGPNTVIHMMLGKAISRAILGLYLLYAALLSKLLEFIEPEGINLTTTLPLKQESYGFGWKTFTHLRFC